MSGLSTGDELKQADSWLQRNFVQAANAAAPTRLPLSFMYDDAPGDQVSEGWQAQWTEGPAREGARVGHLVLTHPSSGLRVQIEVTAFEQFPAVEWVCEFENTGGEPTPIIADILPLDVIFEAPADAPCVLHHAKGSDCKIDDFAPLESAIAPGGEVELAPALGRSSNGTLPFFNLQMGDGGVIGAIGWTGGWQAGFTRSQDGGVRVKAGMQETHLRLLPGERIRSPRIMLLLWQGDRPRAHNMLRRLILDHYTPQPQGRQLQAPMCNAVWGENHAANQIKKAQWWIDNDLPLDMFWIDAGWHGDGAFRENSTVFNSDWYQHVGNWWPNKTTYPEGLGPVGSALADMGLGFVLWLEPERVYKDTFFTREHPQWLLGPIGDNCLLNLGNPQAREALTDLLSGLITQGHITCYRQDFNTDPAPFWQAADAPDRVGISEIRHIEGLYAFWDELLRRHPGLIIDNCSSGGRRIDLETISRSIPLWRSDYQCYPDFDPIGMQAQTHGLSAWVPLSTGCCDRHDTYAFRSALGPGIIITTNIYEPEPSTHFATDWLRDRMREQQALSKYFYGDFYPLVSFSLSDDVWAAWQFDRPDLGEGMVLALRRPRSPFARMEAPLRGLDPEASYRVTSMDDSSVVELTGAQLQTHGLPIEIRHKPGSALFIYRRTGN